MVEEHIFRVSYEVDGRSITTVRLSRREIIEFIAGIGGHKVLHLYERDQLALAEMEAEILQAACIFSQNQGIGFGSINQSGRKHQQSQPRC